MRRSGMDLKKIEFCNSFQIPKTWSQSCQIINILTMNFFFYIYPKICRGGIKESYHYAKKTIRKTIRLKVPLTFPSSPENWAQSCRKRSCLQSWERYLIGHLIFTTHGVSVKTHEEGIGHLQAIVCKSFWSDGENQDWMLRSED